MRRNTIARHYIITLTVSVLVMLFFSAMLIYKDREVYKSAAVGEESSVLANSTTAYYSYLISLMLRSDNAALDKYLKQIRVEEGLESVTLLKPGPEAARIIDRCRYHSKENDTAGYIPRCHYTEGDSVFVVQNIITASRTIGYLVKVQKLELMSVMDYLLQRPIVLVWFLFVILFGLHYMRELHIHLVKPLAGLSRNANRIKMDEVNNYKLYEVNYLANALVRARCELVTKSTLAAIGKTASCVAHDMRSPLAVLKAYLGSHAPVDKEDEEYHAAADRSVDKLLRMANDLVDYAKASHVERSPQRIRRLICKEVVGGMSSRNAEKGIRIVCNVGEDITADVDGYKIERVLTNLVGNSIQAITDGGMITVGAFSEGGNVLVMKVEDDGVGMSGKDLSRVFDSFFTKGKRGGTGLGLAYCKQVVEAHGGTIEVESEVGKGTAFTIRIPNCIVDKVPEFARKNEPEISCDNRRFIIVDDDADIRLRWRKIVQDNGGTVVREASSLEEVKACDTEIDYDSVDVAMVDYQYDGSVYCGTDVIRYMREKGIGEIHLCTGHYDDEDVRSEAFSAGADSVIPKG